MAKTVEVTCGKCHRKFRGDFGLKIHMNSKHPEGKKTKSPISKPLKQTSKRVTRYSMNVTIVPDAKKQYNCDQCDKSFRNENYLTRHVNVTHNASQFKCDKCHKIFGNKRSLKGHENHCKKEPTETISTAVQIWQNTKCDTCDRFFSSLKGLKTHKRFCKPVTFDCDACDSKLKSRETLELHKKFCHEIPEEMEREIVMYACDMCDAKFPEKNILLLHMNIIPLGWFLCVHTVSIGTHVFNNLLTGTNLYSNPVRQEYYFPVKVQNCVS